MSLQCWLNGQSWSIPTTIASSEAQDPTLTDGGDHRVAIAGLHFEQRYNEEAYSRFMVERHPTISAEETRANDLDPVPQTVGGDTKNEGDIDQFRRAYECAGCYRHEQVRSHHHCFKAYPDTIDWMKSQSPRLSVKLSKRLSRSRIVQCCSPDSDLWWTINEIVRYAGEADKHIKALDQARCKNHHKGNKMDSKLGCKVCSFQRVKPRGSFRKIGTFTEAELRETIR